MNPRLLALVLLPALCLAGGDSLSISFRGKEQQLARLRPAAQPPAVVIFLPGDGGWRGRAVEIAGKISSMGYEVYGFDTRKYLEAFSEGGSHLSHAQLASDMCDLARQVRVSAGRPVILAGWSQGAAMAVAAVSSGPPDHGILGVVTIGLPESAALGWDFRATLASLAHRDPGQPAFDVQPLLGRLRSPVWMIYGGNDEYTTAKTARGLFVAAAPPKRATEIAGANHRFDGHMDELCQSLKEGLQWLLAR